MHKTINHGIGEPTAFLCINKSRVKIYNNQPLPTYYLGNEQEFQLELYNGTANTILAKIYLNDKQISQGGLVLKPAERVFLERYLDIAKKFKFETYEVDNTSEVRDIIKNNGDLKVEFYNEMINDYRTSYTYTTNIPFINPSYPVYPIYEPFKYTLNDNSNYLTGNVNVTSSDNSSFTNSNNSMNIGFYSQKSIETGRVDVGSDSEQKLKTVEKSFSYIPFHTVEYKLLPISQKIISSDDINVRRYCSSCGSKISKGDKYCSNCGLKL
jgi:hypothetical protein